jgi:hypothetical protein
MRAGVYCSTETAFLGGCRTKDGGIGRALVDGTFEALQSIRLSASMITDHLANSYYEGLGRENLTHKTFIEEGKMPAPETGKGASGEEGEQKKGDEGEKAEEDEGEGGDGAESGGGEKGDAKSNSDQHGDGEKDGGG